RELKIVCDSTFFFQSEDGIRDRNVTGVQTCALPISRAKPLASDDVVQTSPAARRRLGVGTGENPQPQFGLLRRLFLGILSASSEIGRASCREREWMCGVARW